jgi:hypothetical protein
MKHTAVLGLLANLVLLAATRAAGRQLLAVSRP